MVSVSSPPGMRLAAEYSDPGSVSYGITLEPMEE
jgi:hypothetical protein